MSVRTAPGKKQSKSVQDDASQKSNVFAYDVADDSRDTAERVLKWFISPLCSEEWESRVKDQRFYHVQRSDPNYYSGLFSRESFMQVVAKRKLEYEKHL